MTKTSQKTKELQYFDAFRQAFPSLAQGQLSQPDPPEPDIVLETSLGAVGIELTEISPAGEYPRRLEAHEESIVQQARQKYQEAGGPSRQVDVYWASDHTVSYADRHLPKALANAVLGALPPVGSDSILDNTPEATHPCDFPGIDRVWIYRFGDLNETHWACPRVGAPVSTGTAVLQWELDRNSSKIARYSIRYYEKWIVLITEAAGPSTWVHLPAAYGNHRFTTSFDRAFLLDLGQARHQKLPVALDWEEPFA